MNLRQGDVLLVRVAGLPEGAATERSGGSIVLAEGEATGHAHVVASPRASLHRVRGWDEDERYLVVRALKPVQLRHEEHDILAIPPGVWKVRRQREYDPWREQWVED
jgi:hypothetical protein